MCTVTVSSLDGAHELLHKEKEQNTTENANANVHVLRMVVAFMAALVVVIMSVVVVVMAAYANKWKSYYGRNK